MKTEDLTVVETKGTLIQRAEQFGQAVRSNYRATVLLFEAKRSLLESPTGRQITANVLRRFFADYQDLVPVLEAFARGVGASSQEVLESNILLALAKSRLDGCTGFVLNKAGHTVIGQNWDTGESAASMAVLEIGRSSEGPDTVRFTSPLGLDFWAGVNPWGLAMGGCSGPGGDPMGTGDGLTVTLWRGALFYRCQTVQDVEMLVRTVPMVGKGTNSVFVDSYRRMLWVQQGGGQFGLHIPDTSYLAATGYRPNIEEPKTAKDHAEKHRWQRFMTLGQEAVQSVLSPVSDVQTILADHHVVDGHPDSAPCRHDGPENSTQFSVVVDLAEQKVFYAGQPCCNEWREISLN